MIARHHPIAHVAALLALLAGQAAMATMPCAQQMPGMGSAATHAPADPDDHPSPHQPGHPCCACTCPCRADLVQLPDLAAVVRALTVPSRPVPDLCGTRRLPTLLVPPTLPPVRGPPAFA